MCRDSGMCSWLFQIWLLFVFLVMVDTITMMIMNKHKFSCICNNDTDIFCLIRSTNIFVESSHIVVHVVPANNDVCRRFS